MEDTISLGKRLRFFRERANLTQMDMELAINAASGSLSRIENGQINPTKETLLKIVDALKLNNIEAAHLIGLSDPEVTVEDITSVKESLREYLSSEFTYALLLDNKGYIVLISRGLLKLMPFLKEKIHLLPIHVLEVLFDPSIGVMEMVKNKEKFYAHELSLFRLTSANYMKPGEVDNLISKLKKYPNFNKFWEESKKIKEPFLSRDVRKVVLGFDGEEVQMEAYFRHLNIDPRFELIEYKIIN